MDKKRCLFWISKSALEVAYSPLPEPNILPLGGFQLSLSFQLVYNVNFTPVNKIEVM